MGHLLVKAQEIFLAHFTPVQLGEGARQLCDFVSVGGLVEERLRETVRQETRRMVLALPLEDVARLDGHERGRRSQARLILQGHILVGIQRFVLDNRLRLLQILVTRQTLKHLLETTHLMLLSSFNYLILNKMSLLVVHLIDGALPQRGRGRSRRGQRRPPRMIQVGFGVMRITPEIRIVNSAFGSRRDAVEQFRRRVVRIRQLLLLLLLLRLLLLLLRLLIHAPDVRAGQFEGFVAFHVSADDGRSRSRL